MNKLGIIVLNWNGHEDTIECLNSLLINEKNNNYTIFLLDNGSKKDSVEYIQKWLEINFIHP
ncbi:glycosyltransferase, partial [Neobacillus niacini]|uniref:glycosyltransferase n=1 Tax=Neobacillus niacini TaxID=86668 RepID=UPI0030009E2C